MGIGQEGGKGGVTDGDGDRLYTGAENSQPHQLWPSFEFNEWILVSYARKARALSTQLGSPAFPTYSTLPSIPPGAPQGRGEEERSRFKRGGGVRWEEGGEE